MAPATFNPHNTLGAVEIGVLISAVLFGVVTVQTYIYYSRYPNDARWKKIMVATTWLAEFAHMILVSHTLYIVTISEYGKPGVLAHPPKSLSTTIIFAGIVSGVVQAYFAHRIYLVSRSWFIPVVCWILIGLRFIAYLVSAIEGIMMGSLAEFTGQWGWLLKTILALGAALDLLIAVTLVYNLKHQRSRAFSGTVGIIDKLIIWTIQTGLLTSLTGIAMLICFLKMEHNFIWLAFFVFLARIFSNSLLASLNAREQLRSMRPDVIEFRTDPSSAVGSNRGRSNLEGINVETTKITEISPDSSWPRAKADHSGA